MERFASESERGWNVISRDGNDNRDSDELIRRLTLAEYREKYRTYSW